MGLCINASFLEKMSGDRSYVRVLEALQARIEGLKRQLTGWAVVALTENSGSVPSINMEAPKQLQLQF